jgi:o-succinylbenzoate---CoA ligase
MDASLLTSSAFWENPQPVLEFPELIDHVLFETSGSSGLPKSVALSKQALLVSAAAVNRHLDVSGKSCWGLALPLYHVGGFGVMARSYQASCEFQCFAQRWDANAFHQWLAHYKVSHTSLVPTQIHDLVKANLTAPITLEVIVVGGGHLDIITGQAARDLGWPVLASYGMTEAASQIATQGLDLLDAPYLPTPIPLLPIWDARITSGNILELAGSALFSGYVTAGRFIPRATDWHATSDIVRLEDRLISPLGRMDSLVKILGELVDPVEIEREIAVVSAGKLIPGTFAVIAIPDPRSGNGLLPIFESSVDPGIIENTLSIYAQQALGFRRLKAPMIVHLLPRSELGKIRRNELLLMVNSIQAK